MKHFLPILLLLANSHAIFSQNTDESNSKVSNNTDHYMSYSSGFDDRNAFVGGTLFEKEHVRLSEAYPNPAITQATIDYAVLNADTKASIVIHNLLGNKMVELSLDHNQSSVKIPTDNFGNGIYFYSLYVNEKRIMTKKIVVKK